MRSIGSFGRWTLSNFPAHLRTYLGTSVFLLAARSSHVQRLGCSLLRTLLSVRSCAVSLRIRHPSTAVWIGSNRNPISWPFTTRLAYVILVSDGMISRHFVQGGAGRLGITSPGTLFHEVLPIGVSPPHTIVTAAGIMVTSFHDMVDTLLDEATMIGWRRCRL